MSRVDEILQEAGKVYDIAIVSGPRSGQKGTGDKDAIFQWMMTKAGPDDMIQISDHATGRKINSGTADWFRDKFDKLFGR